EATQITTLALFLFMCLQPAAGALSDRIGRKPLMISFGVLGVLFTYFLFDKLGQTQDYWSAFWICLAGLVSVTRYTYIQAVVNDDLFLAHMRALGVALRYALGNMLFGGTAEYFALSFKEAGHESWFFIYVTILISISLIVYIFMKDTKHNSE